MAFKRQGRGRGQGDGGKKDFEQKIVEIKRVTRVVAGGKRMRFRALVVIGDKKGRVGIGLKKGADVSEAVNKAVTAAKKTMIPIKIVNDTIPHEIKFKYKSSVVFLKPAQPGTGVIAGGAIRQVLDLVGVRNVLSKMLGSSNKVNNVMATYLALSKLRSKEEIASRKAVQKVTE
ncbi:MAG: 30S ribosomal protein S5 [Candidatus Doudnabacteria bacterium]